MSLLLDALKKAAEKKAQKSGQSASASDTTRTETLAGEETESFTRTERMEADEIEATEVEATEVEETLVRTQRLDETEVDRTEVDRTEVDESASAYTQTQRIDDSHVETTRIDATETDTVRFDATEVDPTHLETIRMDATEVDATEMDATELDATEVDATEVEPGDVDEIHVQTQNLEAAAFEQTRRMDPDSPTASAVDEGDEDDTETRLEAQQEDAASSPFDELASDTTEFSAIDAGSDPTMLVMDDSIPLDRDGNALIETDEYDAEEMARLRAASRPDLTQDDVTAFLGEDGQSTEASGLDHSSATRTVEMRPVSLGDLERSADHADTDDSTLTNPEELARQAREDSTHRRSRKESPVENYDDDQSTVINPESPAAGVDIDGLTNEQTLGGQTGSQYNYAPDNYDRTLIKLSETDVSRIFPGIKPEPGAVMTPDYAKKVFMSKSSRHAGSSLKWLGGLALILLLMVGLWSMFELTDESERIDNSLARLKRDPMPGVIQPPKEKKVDLFAGAGNEGTRGASLPPPSEAQAEALTAPSGAVETRPSTPSPQETPAVQEPTRVASADSSNDEAGSSPQAPATAPAVQRRPSGGGKAAVAAASATGSASAHPARLQLSRGERIDQKDRLLNEAYAAYEQGDLQQARRDYAEVLELDPDNRDALLGMAAIEVQDGDYSRAIDLYQRLLLLNPKDSEAMASLLTVANIDPQTGESRIKAMLREQPDAPYLYFTLGNMYSRQQRWAEAQAAYFKALQLKPDDANAAYNLAVSLEHLGKPKAAIPYYRRALENQGRVLATFDPDQVAQRIEVLNP